MTKKHDVIMRTTEVPETLHMSRLQWKVSYNSIFIECRFRVSGAWEITSPTASPASHHSLSRIVARMPPSGVPRFLISQCCVLHHEGFVRLIPWLTRQSPIKDPAWRKLILVQCLLSYVLPVHLLNKLIELERFCLLSEDLPNCLGVKVSS